MVDHGAHVSTKGLIHAVSLDAVPCWVRGGQGRVGGAHGETRVRGPVTSHLPCILFITCDGESYVRIRMFCLVFCFSHNSASIH